MKNLRSYLCAMAVTVAVNYSVAQEDSAASTTSTPEAAPAVSPEATGSGEGIKRLDAVWIFGIHGVVVDDDGETFKDLFNVSKAWNFLPYPTRITVERTMDEIHRAWRVEAALSYSQYKKGKVVNEREAYSTQPFVAFDLNAKYDLNALIGETSVFDPYPVIGVGFTHRSSIAKKNTPTVNLGLGFNVWIYKGFGINLQTTAKFKILPNTSNYLMHSAGIVYRFNFVAKDNGTIKPQM